MWTKKDAIFIYMFKVVPRSVFPLISNTNRNNNQIKCMYTYRVVLGYDFFDLFQYLSALLVYNHKHTTFNSI